MLPDTDNRKVRKAEFRDDLVDNDGRVKYNLIELKIDKVKYMWRSFRRRLTKGSIELDVKISRFADDIVKMMKRLESSGSV